MGTQARARPKRLAEKLLAIRKQLDSSQSQLARKLDFDKGPARICEYETNVREPDLFVLLSYAKAAGICTCVLIDDNLDLPKTKPRQQGRTHSHVQNSVSKKRMSQKGRRG